MGPSEPDEGTAAEHAVRSTGDDPGYGPLYVAHRHPHAPGIRCSPAIAGVDDDWGCGDGAAPLVRCVVGCSHGHGRLERPTPSEQPPPVAGAISHDGCRRVVLDRIRLAIR